MAEKAAVFIDGGYLNKINTEKFKLDYQRLLSCLLGSSMELWRAYYYNCLPYRSSNPSEDDKERFNNAQRFYFKYFSFNSLVPKFTKGSATKEEVAVTYVPVEAHLLLSSSITIAYDT